MRGHPPVDADARKLRAGELRATIRRWRGVRIYTPLACPPLAEATLARIAQNLRESAQAQATARPPPPLPPPEHTAPPPLLTFARLLRLARHELLFPSTHRFLRNSIARRRRRAWSQTEPPSWSEVCARHKLCALLVAIGLPDTSVSLLTGHQPPVLAVFKNDPSFKELVANYTDLLHRAPSAVEVECWLGWIKALCSHEREAEWRNMSPCADA
jgi:hypothetical protein